jgi:hypothetical protein
VPGFPVEPSGPSNTYSQRIESFSLISGLVQSNTAAPTNKANYNCMYWISFLETILCSGLDFRSGAIGLYFYSSAWHGVSDTFILLGDEMPVTGLSFSHLPSRSKICSLFHVWIDGWSRW